MTVVFRVGKILAQKEMYGKTFYPVTTPDIKSSHGDHIFNAMVPIPKECKHITGELYRYYDKETRKVYWNVKDIRPMVE